MNVMYEIKEGYYKSLLNGHSYTVRDAKGNERKVNVSGLGSKEKVIEYLNNTERLLGTITELVFKN